MFLLVIIVIHNRISRDITFEIVSYGVKVLMIIINTNRQEFMQREKVLKIILVIYCVSEIKNIFLEKFLHS